MNTTEDILINNLQESLRVAHKYLVLGAATSLFIVLLVLRDLKYPDWSTDVTIPNFGISAKSPLVVIIAMIACFLSGLLARLAVERVEQIIKELHSSEEIIRAALTYPAIPTIHAHVFRVASALLPGLMIILAAVFSLKTLELNEHGWQESMSATFLLAWPYITLAFKLIRPLDKRIIQSKKVAE